ncbi:MAG: L-threonine 3-dehydrogenase [Elusimicrobia bacterium]|nr:L-threonine 3-dehydrogenase [Elusimicrobiota bacterium]
MLAISKTEPGIGARLVRAETPEIAKDEVLIKVHRASICGSDMSLYNWTSWAPSRIKTPLVFGHEFCGRVEEVGSATKGLKRGDFVSVESHKFCGDCIPCRGGQRHVCQNLKIIGIDTQGGFAQYARVPARCAWKHKDAKLVDIGSLMEPLGNAIYATLCEPVKGQSVVVMGCGPQGLFAIAVARASGADSVIAVEGSTFRRKLALKMGADAVVDPSNNPAAAIKKAAGKRWADGVDVVLEMSGAPPAVELGLEIVRNGGRFTAFGIPPGALSIQWSRDIVFKGIRVYGVAGREIWSTWETMDALLRSGKIDVRPVITHVYPLKDFQRGFDTMLATDKKSGKVVFEVDQ